jgi:3-oxoacyl-[acyl-carrier-protein] synthase III
MGLRSRIIATGSHIATEIIKNEYFNQHQFYTAEGLLNPKPTAAIVQKMAEISGITERRYTKQEFSTSDLSLWAAQDALQSGDIDGETLDYIIVAHNFGDVRRSNLQADMLPNMASRVKARLGIKNPNCVCYDILFGCPSWVQAVIQADYFLKSGDAYRALIIGADVMSAINDPHDVDSMLFADGAGAVILEAVETNENVGIINHKTVTDALQGLNYLAMGTSRRPSDKEEIYIKMQGPNVFKYGLEKVPQAIAACLQKANLSINDVKQLFIHQANARMIKAMMQKLAELYDLTEMPAEKVPYTVQFLGNTSAATVPTLLDLVMKNKLAPHSFDKGDNIILASVGGGMHANCILYKHF